MQSPECATYCEHRSASPTKTAICNVCGSRGQPVDVYHCSLHDKDCVERNGLLRRALACSTCPDNTNPPEPTRRKAMPMEPSNRYVVAINGASWSIGLPPDFHCDGLADLPGLVAEKSIKDRDILIIVESPIGSLSLSTKNQFMSIPRDRVLVTRWPRSHAPSAVYAFRVADIGRLATLRRELMLASVATRPVEQPQPEPVSHPETETAEPPVEVSVPAENLTTGDDEEAESPVEPAADEPETPVDPTHD